MAKVPQGGKIRGKAYMRKRVGAAAPVIDHKIRQWREFVGWSQKRWGELAEVDDASISAYERGEYEPSMENLKKLAAALPGDVTAGMLLEVDPNAAPPLWVALRRASEAQYENIAKVATALIGADEGKKPAR